MVGCSEGTVCICLCGDEDVVIKFSKVLSGAFSLISKATLNLLLNDDIENTKEAYDILITDESRLTEFDVDAKNIILIVLDKKDYNSTAAFKYNKMVVPYSDEFCDKKYDECITYSSENNNADIVAKNIRIHEDKLVFELLGKEEIGRILVPKDDLLQNEVLALAGALLYADVPFMQVISVINSL